MHTQTRIIEDPHLAPMLHRWAARYYASEAEQTQLIEQTIQGIADEILQSPGRPIERTLFCLMHRVAQERLGRHG